ncbi:MAG: tetratricopeptide repeat protein [Clostridiaceae bacterium]|nr:tetratricopeptide repeat protein [Clostridiaceae bacterium]
MFKLNFEKSVIFVLILILCISTANIFSQYIRTFISSKEHNEVQTNITKNISFPARILKADQLFKLGQYEDAQKEYLKLVSMSNLTLQQKATVYFNLGICNYRLKEYDLARDSFLKSAEFNTNDPVSYNNAAVCSFYLNELERAEELQKMAISSLPVIEYHYNLARIYEAWGKYGDSAKYYTAVVRAEENISKEDRIDPVRIKNKVMKLMINSGNIEEMTNELMIVLKLKEAREVFIIDDVNMDIKDKKFKWRIAGENGTNRLYCSYDRKKSDPYSLIDSLKWTVEKGGRTVFTSKKDSFSLPIVKGSRYVVYLDIDYDTNKSATSHVDIMKSNGMYSNSGAPITNPSNAKCKYYEYAVYEQVFEKDFRIRRSGHIDRFNTKWGKDNVEATIMDKDFIDAQSAIYIKNTSGKAAGIWADLSELINEKQLKGRTIGIKFYARKVTANANMIVNIRVKSGKVYKYVPRKYELEYKWKKFGVDVLIPENGDGLTISFATPSGEEVKIDGFIITIVR